MISGDDIRAFQELYENEKPKNSSDKKSQDAKTGQK
jgi:hypothetical protein